MTTVVSVATVLLAGLGLVFPANAQKTYTIGMSQCNLEAAADEC